jgi:hypothetical protein
MNISPTEKLIRILSENLEELLKKVILLSVDIKTFDFKFFANDCNINPKLLDIITCNFDSREEALESIKSLSESVDDYNDADKFAMFLYLRYYNSNNEGEKIIERLLEVQDPEELKLFIGESYLSKENREKLKSITFMELLKNGL